MPDTGGLRKLRFADARRGKGKRGGLRVIYYWWDTGFQFWLFTLYDKGEMADLTPPQRRMFKAMIKAEEFRGHHTKLTEAGRSQKRRGVKAFFTPVKT